ncbi:MAG: RNA polymerase sigma factor [Candidatus Poribacteria bacterium]|nr:RNA polymerase sigma factor [Candidatus Poribacteria bacterium]
MRNDDVALVHCVLTGDETAFAKLVEKYQKQVHAIAWRATKDFHIAEDIAQETFLRAHQKLGTLNDPHRFSAWLNAIAARCCLAWLREKRLNSELSENINIAMGHDDPYSGYLAREQAKEAGQELREIVKKWLAKLPESERTVVTLHYFDGMSCEEIAAFLDVTKNTIKSRLNRARNRLKKNKPLIQSTLDDFQFFATFKEMAKMERKIRVCINATTENGKQFREGGASLIKTDGFLRLSSFGCQEYDKAEPVTMPFLGTAITPSLLRFPLVIGDTWIQEGFWDSLAKTTLDGYEQVKVSAGTFSTCLKHKSALIDTPSHFQNNLLATTNDKPYERGSKKESPFVNGTRYLWFVKGIGLVKTRYEHANGLTTEAELMEYNVPGKTEEYHPLQIGSTYTYKYHSVFLGETVFEKWRVTENF